MVTLERNTPLAVIAVCILWLGVGLSSVVLAQDQTLVETALFRASDSSEGDYFGVDIAIEGNRALIGASYGSKGMPGYAYVLEKQASGEWVEVARLSDGDDDSEAGSFGISVALQGNTAYVGDHREGSGDQSGAIYVFERQADGAWVEVQKIVHLEQSAGGGFFGAPIAVDGNTMLVGSGNLGGNGFVHEYERGQDGLWHRVRDITTQLNHYDEFGGGLILQGDRAIVAAPGDRDRHPGTVHVFDREADGSWRESWVFYGFDAKSFGFGSGISLDGNRLAIGADWRGGSVLLFEEQPDSTWTQTDRIFSDDPERVFFGSEVILDGSRLLVTDDGTDIGEAGSVGTLYVLDQIDGAWTETQKIHPSQPEELMVFGLELASSGGQVLVGAPQLSDEQAGSVYFYEYEQATTTSAEDTAPLDAFALGGAYPNPARGRARVPYTLGRAAQVEIAAYDVLGRRVQTLTSGQQAAGRHEAELGAGLAPGVYLVRAVFTTGEERHTFTQRVTVVQ